MLIRRLHPDPAEVDTLDDYAVPDTDRHLRVNMVCGVDGGAAVEGRVGVLSGAADQVLLHELRTLCDVLLVGAGTIRAEGYGPIRLSEEQQQRRVAAGIAPVPRLAVLSRSLDLDLESPVFTKATARPILLTTAGASPHRRAEAAKMADLLDTDGLPDAIDRLARTGLPRILSEGGPHVLSQLYAAGLVDELCLAIAPVVTGGEDLRITAGPPLKPPKMQQLTAVSEREGFLFLRYNR